MNRSDTLVITGSNGFVGQSLIQYIDKLTPDLVPEKIVTINRNKNVIEHSSLKSKIEFEDIQFDLCKPWDFEIANARVINLAADGSENSYTDMASERFFMISENLSNWAIRNKPKSVFHASSGACYGIVPLRIPSIDEPFSTKPISKKDSFIRARLQSEKLLQNVLPDRDIKLVIGRLFSFVGPTLLQKKQYAISSLINSAITSNKVVVNGNPATVRSFLHEVEMSSWIYKALNIDVQSSLLSIGSAIGVRISELAELIALVTGTHVEYANPTAFGDIYVADNSSTLERLGVSETKNWQDGVMECIEIAKGSKN